MFYLLAQMSLLGQGRDIESWMDMLILVIIAVIYMLGAILKTAKRKKEEQEKSQKIQKSQQIPQKQPLGGRGILEQIFTEIKKAAEEASKGAETDKPVQRVAQKQVRPPVAVQKYAGQAKQISPSQVKAAPSPPIPAKPKVTRTTPKVESEFDKLAQLDKGIHSLPGISTKISGLPSKKKAKPSETVEYMYLSDVLSDYYKDPDELKRAILHYEILGKPLALRNPDESIIGLC